MLCPNEQLAEYFLSSLLFLQNTVLKTWQGKQENVEAAQKALLVRAKANSDAQRGQYDPGEFHFRVLLSGCEKKR